MQPGELLRVDLLELVVLGVGGGNGEEVAWGPGPTHLQPQSLCWAPLLGFSPTGDRLWVLPLALGARGTAGTTANMGLPHSRGPHMGVHRSSDLSHG